MYNDFANNQDAKKDKATRLNELAKKRMFLTFSVDFSIPIVFYNFNYSYVLCIGSDKLPIKR
jgi:hypothetical protein